MLAIMERAGAKTEWSDTANEIAAAIASYNAQHDADDSFVEEGFAALTDAGFFKALVPPELGGGGASVREICDVLRIVGASC